MHHGAKRLALSGQKKNNKKGGGIKQRWREASRAAERMTFVGAPDGYSTARLLA